MFVVSISPDKIFSRRILIRTSKAFWFSVFIIATASEIEVPIDAKITRPRSNLERYLDRYPGAEFAKLQVRFFSAWYASMAAVTPESKEHIASTLFDIIENHKAYGFVERDMYNLGHTLLSVVTKRVVGKQHNRYTSIGEVSLIMFRKTHGKMDIIGSGNILENDPRKTLLLRIQNLRLDEYSSKRLKY
jgi:hypothetical protein